MSEVVGNKQIHIIGGGTFEPVTSHLAIAAPARGTTARRLGELTREMIPEMDTNVHLTQMADPSSSLRTSEDLRGLATEIVNDYATKIVFMSAMVADFQGKLRDGVNPQSGKPDSREPHTMDLLPNPKIVQMFRKETVEGQTQPRKDIFLAAFKTTVGAPPDIQYMIGLKALKENGANLVLANDTETRMNMVIVPEESAYGVGTDREKALRKLVEIAFLRSQLTFTRSTVIGGELIDMDSDEVYPSARAVIQHLIDSGAYKAIDNKTAGHYAVKISDNEFITSVRKTNFNTFRKLVRVTTDREDHVIAHGATPSVGGQSQRIVYERHPEMDCIAHAHVPLRSDAPDDIPVVSQEAFECGSHQCGQNTAGGLGVFENGLIKAVMLDNHGPNIVWHHSTDPQLVIDFFDRNFDASQKTGGYVAEAA
ncbi:MAG TPA: phosphopantothenoylcysteine decarboxylase [Candidatus Saccharimonadales bacterium]